MAVEWKTIPDYPNYLININGEVMRQSCSYGNYPENKIMTPSSQGQVSLKAGSRYKTVAVAALLLLTFVGPPPAPEKNLARHLDDDKKNNSLSNLAWGDRNDNIQDAVRNGRQGKGSPGRDKTAAKLRGVPRPDHVKKKISETTKGVKKPRRG